LAVLVGDQGEAVEVGVEGAERVDLGAVAAACGWAAAALFEAVAPVLEVAVDFVGADAAGVALVEPAVFWRRLWSPITGTPR
jgi:hypothetical protein